MTGRTALTPQPPSPNFGRGGLPVPSPSIGRGSAEGRGEGFDLPAVPLLSPNIDSAQSKHPVGISVLGSTGSIGRQTLDVIDHLPDEFRVVALAAGRNAALLAEQARRYEPDLVAAGEGANVAALASHRVLTGSEGLIAAATHPAADIVVVATSGHAAIVPTCRAIEQGKTIALANKETIVCAGAIIVPLAAKHGVEIRPVDSEHSAIWQSLGRSSQADIRRLIVTASGGPFRLTKAAALDRVTVKDALAHPTWSMGSKVTIDSATLMNKGLEVIEAHWLFGMPYDRIDVLVHPESIIHSLVEFEDGSQIGQLGLPDMRLPIQYALTFPRHLPRPHRSLDLAEIGALHFEPPDPARFPLLRLAREAGVAGNTYPTVLSGADEVAVAAFLTGQIAFPNIARIVDHVVEKHCPDGPLSLEAIAAADAWARREAMEHIDR